MFINQNFIESRSKLYNLEVKGIGTPEVESLTSYISRLASAHNITAFKLLKFFRENELINTKLDGLSIRSSAFNGNGENSKQITSSLEILTGRYDIRNLSLHDFFKFLKQGKVLKLYKSWCPTCLLMDELKSDEVYERLIWQFEIIKICPIHNCKLETKCPGCKKQNPILSTISPIGYCHYCQCKLSGSYPKKYLKKDERDFQLYSYNEIGLLLSLPLEKREKLVRNELKFLDIMTNILSQVKAKYGFNGKMFCDYLGIGTNVLSSWKKGGSNPSLSNLIKVSYVLNTNLINLFLNEVNINKIRPFPNKYSQYLITKKQSRTNQEIEKIIDEILYKPYYQGLTLNEVANKVGFRHAASLRIHHPEVYKKISAWRSHYLEKERKIRLKKLEDNILKAMITLSSKGIKPTPWMVNKELKKPIVFLEPSNKGIYDKVYKELFVNLESNRNAKY